jgi:uncharacterized membrane protein
MGHARWWVRSLSNNAVWQAALARTLSLSSYALTAAGRAHDAEADAQRAWSGALAAVDSVTRATGRRRAPRADGDRAGEPGPCGGRTADPQQ